MRHSLEPATAAPPSGSSPEPDPPRQHRRVREFAGRYEQPVAAAANSPEHRAATRRPQSVRVRAPSLPGARLARPAPGVVAIPRLPVSGSSPVPCSAGEAKEPLQVSVRAARLWASHPA